MPQTCGASRWLRAGWGTSWAWATRCRPSLSAAQWPRPHSQLSTAPCSLQCQGAARSRVQLHLCARRTAGQPWPGACTPWQARPDGARAEAAGTQRPGAELPAQVAEAAARRTDIAEALGANRQWPDWAARVLRPHNERDNVMHWACGRPSASDMHPPEEASGVLVSAWQASLMPSRCAWPACMAVCPPPKPVGRQEKWSDLCNCLSGRPWHGLCACSRVPRLLPGHVMPWPGRGCVYSSYGTAGLRACCHTLAAASAHGPGCPGAACAQDMEDRPETGPTGPGPVPSASAATNAHRYSSYGATDDDDDGDLSGVQAWPASSAVLRLGLACSAQCCVCAPGASHLFSRRAAGCCRRVAAA